MQLFIILHAKLWRSWGGLALILFCQPGTVNLHKSLEECSPRMRQTVEENLQWQSVDGPIRRLILRGRCQ